MVGKPCEQGHITVATISHLQWRSQVTDDARALNAFFFFLGWVCVCVCGGGGTDGTPNAVDTHLHSSKPTVPSVTNQL